MLEHRVVVLQPDNSLVLEFFDELMFLGQRGSCDPTDASPPLLPTENQHAIHQKRKKGQHEASADDRTTKRKAFDGFDFARERLPASLEIQPIDRNDRAGQHPPKQQRPEQSQALKPDS